MAEGARDRAILHVDMDAFYVSVELLSRPELEGRQVIVGHAGERSVVLSASYPCRSLGVRSAMPMSAAVRMAPRAVVLEPDMAAYRHYSGRIMAIFREVTPLVEQVSVDEAFLDVTGSLRRLGHPQVIGDMIRRRIRTELGLPASVGIARNKFVAKVASTRAKPDGLLAVPPAQTARFLHSLPVRSLWGVGERTAQVLAGAGIATVADLAQVPVRTLERMLGAQGPQLHALAWGLDDRPVEPVRVEKSIGAEETFARDVSEPEALRRELLRLSHRVAERLRASGREAGTVVLKVRYADFSTITRSRRLAQPAGAAPALHQAAESLLDALGALPQPVRLLGVRAEQLAESAGHQLSIDRSEGNWRQAEEAMDRIRARFPQGAVRPATLLPGRGPSEGPAGAGA
ncbi:DNA polymerase IV [Zafaria cholistanensis]|uniref:DNA polymerase IV n=1 Tax=Zafaria cholistanensis TaxID=1682741 RepID=A0A5A7NU84_9MICC|nr:DNA polymerase IV [Zafaria cholistanensis]GER24363.1 DNA polymerase IV [Zafaria cholistanensis]